jgi:hypothetical protein
LEVGVILDKDRKNAEIAQLVEQRTENPRVAGSIPALGINKHQIQREFRATTLKVAGTRKEY